MSVLESSLDNSKYEKYLKHSFNVGIYIFI